MSTDATSRGLALLRHRRRAAQHVELGQWDAARGSLEAVLQEGGDDPAVRADLAAVLMAGGHLRDAISQWTHAAARAPAEPGRLLPLARQLYFAGELVVARDCLARIDWDTVSAPAALAEAGRVRWLLGEFGTALALCGRAIRQGIDAPDALYLHAMLLQFHGRLDEAESVLLQCLRRWPRFGDAAVALVHLRRQAGPAHVGLIEDLVRRLPADPQHPVDRLALAHFESALFKIHDDLGDHARAWACLQRSNARMARQAPYDRAGERAVVDALLTAARRLPPPPDRAISGAPGPRPVFIVGLPRSGTTLLDRMLSSHPQVVSAGEINDFRRQMRWITDVPADGVAGMLAVLDRLPAVDFALLGERYRLQTRWRAPEAGCLVDKMPIHFRMVPFIRQALPDAVIVHIHREPMDVCYSNLKAMLGPASAYSYDMDALAHYHGLYRRCMEQWMAIDPDVVVDVRYEDLVRAPEPVLRDLLTRCGLAFDPACLQPERNDAPVATPSSSQVREPVHARSVGEWQRYAEPLEPLRQALAR
ncbi:MAG: sulfotransferase [Xanthomonadaceae bacterium]|nr:sulfotransferase [Xanthomonadaceae bacterium]MDE1964279.1 sulfotransferase [Xanthomonadaceae bacterium]